jgi:4-amino-4-deoxy-L-arabinose transferase-like glycosyltransferase
MGGRYRLPPSVTALATRPEPAGLDRPARAEPAVTPRVAAVVAAVLAVVYLASRLWFADRFPYFLDEGTYARFTERAAESYHQLFISLEIGREPLQMWLGLPLVELGVNPLTAMRAVSVAAGLATVVVVGLLARRLAGDLTGLVAASLAVVLPFFLVHDGIGIMEPLVTLIMAAALLAQVELARRPSLRLGVVLGVVLGAAILTKENTKPAIALIPVGLLLLDWSPEGRRERLRRWGGAVAIALAMAVGANVLMRLSAYWKELVAERADKTLYTVREVSDVLSDPFASWGLAWEAYGPAFSGYLTLPLAGAAVGGAVLALRRRPRSAVVLLAWVALPLVIALSFALGPFPRHVMYLMPPILVLAAYGIVEAGRFVTARLEPRWAAIACTVALALLLTPALVADARFLAHPDTARYPDGDDVQYVTGTGGGSVWPAIRDRLRERAGPGPVVVLHPRAVPLVVEMMLDDPRFVFVEGKDPRAPRGEFVLIDEIPFADFESLGVFADGDFRLIGSYERPRGGATIKLYERAGR